MGNRKQSYKGKTNGVNLLLLSSFLVCPTAQPQKNQAQDLAWSQVSIKEETQNNVHLNLYINNMQSKILKANIWQYTKNSDLQCQGKGTCEATTMTIEALELHVSFCLFLFSSWWDTVSFKRISFLPILEKTISPLIAFMIFFISKYLGDNLGMSL